MVLFLKVSKKKGLFKLYPCVMFKYLGRKIRDRKEKKGLLLIPLWK
jgi:hypothetical protein